MTAGRLYCIQSWNNASETSGEQIGSRLSQSRGLHFDRMGNANVALYAEENTEKKNTKISLKQRILPQFARLEKLTAEIIELEEANHKDEFTPEEYTLLRSVAFKKRDRAQILLNKAISTVHTPENNDESEEFGVEYATQNSVTEVACGVAWIDELSSSNCFKSFLKNTCKAFKLAVHCKYKAATYIQSLKDL